MQYFMHVLLLNRATKMGSEIFHIQQVRQVGLKAIQAIGLYNWWCRRTLSLSGLEGSLKKDLQVPPRKIEREQ